ncbi:MAG: hypothetical protein PGN25_22745 [Methylorubrum populi]
MSKKLTNLLDRAKAIGMSLNERETQRRSFAYGSAHIENERVTRDTIRLAEEDLKRHKGATGDVR